MNTTSSTEKPFFSIIIPTYNRCEFVLKTLDSVLGQQFSNFEVIVVDDGGTDQTGQEVQAIRDDRVIYHRIENSERGAARNYGACVAKGAYLNFFDSDDLMNNDHLSEAHKFILENQHPAWFHTGYEIINEKGTRIVSETGESNPEKRLIESNYLGCDSVFLRSDVFAQNKFQDDRKLASSEDWELWLRIISRHKLVHTSRVTLRMINHDARSIFTISPDRVIERDTLLLHCLLQDKFFVDKFRKEIPLFEADRYTFFSLNLLLAKRNKEALRFLVKSIRASKRVLKRKRFWACVKIAVTNNFNS